MQQFVKNNSPLITQTNDGKLSSAQLPIHNFREQIINTINSHSVTIISGSPGTGKSTQVPKFLLEQGQTMVITQPRVFAAQSLAERVAFEMKQQLGELVGYHTGEGKQTSPQTRCLFCTDGLALVRELVKGRFVLIIDEVHTWNINIEVLVGWAKHLIEKGANLKLVLMSATVDTAGLAAFFDTAPVIEIPGRQYPLQERAPGPSMTADICSLVREGRSPLVFLEGKHEIEKQRLELIAAKVPAEILPLHSELSLSEQKRCMQLFGRPKIILATNIAESSVTIPGISAVVDSGKERRIEIHLGVEGLYTRPISQANRKQRAGRAGREGPGIYIGRRDDCDLHPRAYPVPEIESLRLSMTILRLRMAGFRIEEIKLYHQPPAEAVRRDINSLISLNCLTPDGELTQTGKQVAQLPVDPHIGRMLVEAKRLNVLQEVIVVAAILEVGGVLDRKNTSWRFLCGDEKDSELIANLKCYLGLSQSSDDVISRNGLFPPSMRKVSQICTKLSRALNVPLRSRWQELNKEKILKCVLTGMLDNIYSVQMGELRDKHGNYRLFCRDSIIKDAGDWVIGKPFDLELRSARGEKVIKPLIQLASKIKANWIVELAPHLVEYREVAPLFYNPDCHQVQIKREARIQNQIVSVEQINAEKRPGASECLIEFLAAEIESIRSRVLPSECATLIRGFKNRIQEARELNSRSGEVEFPEFKGRELRSFLRERIDGSTTLSSLDFRQLLPPPLNQERRLQVLSEYPDQVKLPGYGFCQVSYGTDPEISITHGWKDLPDGGLFVGKRKIAVRIVSDSIFSSANTDLKQLKLDFANLLLRKQLEKIALPEIRLPTLLSENFTLPAIQKANLGEHPLTGEIVEVFAAARSNTNSASLTWVWYLSEQAAQEVQRETIQRRTRLEQSRLPTDSKSSALTSSRVIGINPMARLLEGIDLA